MLPLKAMPHPATHSMEEAADIDARPPEFTDEALALRFTERYSADLRYVAAWGYWLCYDGTQWKRDDTLSTLDKSRGICREASQECKKPSTAAQLASAKTVYATERLARTDRRHAATVDQWDRDLWALNTPAGVVNLKTGKLRPHSREDYCTLITAVPPGKGCDTFLAFMDRITNRDDELIAFLQRQAGYCLTGSTREHALFFGYGTGANGKSVYTNTIAGILGDYATNAPMESFVASQSDRHPTDLAGFRGARLVTSIETEEGRRWSESRIKALTGGDKITARFMRQDFFEYTPQFKLLIAGNHRPGIRNIDEAMRRRLHLIPFTVTIPPEERDLELANKLRAEWPGILAWMIQGCLQWQEVGLSPPATVTAATADYFASEDGLERWITDRCVTGMAYRSKTADLFASWREWCEETGEFAGTEKRFVANLTSRPSLRLAPWRDNKARGYQGIQAIKQNVASWHG